MPYKSKYSIGREDEVLKGYEVMKIARGIEEEKERSTRRLFVMLPIIIAAFLLALFLLAHSGG